MNSLQDLFNEYGSRPVEGPRPAPLNRTSADDTLNAMDGRLSAIEAHLGHVKGDVAELKTDVKATATKLGVLEVGLATLTERVTHLPNKGFIITAVLMTMAVLGAITTFAPAIQKLVGVIH